MTTFVFAASDNGSPKLLPSGVQPSLDGVSWLTLYIIVLFAIPSRLVIGPLGSAGSVSMVFGLASLGLWVLGATLRTGSSATLRARPIRWGLGALIFCVGVSYVLAMSRPLNSDEMSPADVALLSLLSWSGTLLFAHDGVGTRRRLNVLVWRLALAGGFMAALGAAQFFAKRAFVDMLAIPGLQSVADAGIFIRNGLVRPSGTATHPIEFGTLLAIIFPIAIHVALSHRERSLALRWFPAIAIGVVIGISGTRSAYLAALLGVIVMMIAWSPKMRWTFLALAFGGVVVAGIAMPRLLDTIFGLFGNVESDPSIASRTDSIGIALAFIEQFPLFGRGLGTFLPKYRIFDNQYLGMLVSIGIIGTVVLLSFIGVIVVQLMHIYSDIGGADGGLAMALAGATLAGFVSFAFFDSFAFPMTMGTLFLVIGLGGALSRLSSQSEFR